jgi:Outer membrane protein beta-barrel domain
MKKCFDFFNCGRLFKSVLPLLFFLVFFLFQSCSRKTAPAGLTLEASLERGKILETGQSAIKYDSKTGQNVYVWDEFIDPINPVKFYPNDERESFLPEKKATGFFSLDAGLGFVTKGAKFPAGAGFINLNYLELPVCLQYHYSLGIGNLYGGLGPYFAYGIGGKSGGVSSYGENNGGFKHFDIGSTFMLGYKLDMGLSLDFRYDLGLGNIEYASEDVKGHSRSYGINIGYQIGRLFAKK